MTEHDHDGHVHPEHVHSRTRNIWNTILDDGGGDDDGTLIAVDHVYLPEGSFDDCGDPGHDPGLVGIIVGDGGALLEPELALVLADRIKRAAHLVLESREEPADIERDMARFAAAAREDGAAQ